MWLLVAGAVLYVLTFLALYPRTTAIVDEDAYLTEAYLFRTGRLSYEGSPIPAPHMTVESGGRLASKYPPGNSLFLLPFTLFGWRAVFVSGLLLGLAGIVLIAAGLLGLAYGGFSYTKETHDTKIGPLELSLKDKGRVNIPIWAGVAAVGAGAVLLIVPWRARR